MWWHTPVVPTLGRLRREVYFSPRVQGQPRKYSKNPSQRNEKNELSSQAPSRAAVLTPKNLLRAKEVT
jgi:hypothetical protein